MVEIRPPSDEVLPGVLRAAQVHNLPVETLSSAGAEARWPALRIPESLVAVHERQAGYLLVEECVRAQLDCATANGAELVAGVAVERCVPNAQGVRVSAGGKNYSPRGLSSPPGPGLPTCWPIWASPFRCACCEQRRSEDFLAAHLPGV